MGHMTKQSVGLHLNPSHLVARPCNSVCGAHRAFAGRPQASRRAWPPEPEVL